MTRTVTIALALALLVAACVDDSQAKGKGKRNLGIVGKEAPAWSVSKWFNLPKGVESLDVKDYRGKVVYLFFFQSW